MCDTIQFFSKPFLQSLTTSLPETFKTNEAEFVQVEGGEASASGSNNAGDEEKERSPSGAGGKGSSHKRVRE